MSAGASLQPIGASSNTMCAPLARETGGPPAPTTHVGARMPMGTVNLIGSGRDKAHEGRSHEGLCPSGHAGDRGPGLEGLGPGGSILAGGAGGAGGGGEGGGLIVGGGERLGPAGGL